MNILHITPDFNYACGRSYYVYLLLKYFRQAKHNVLLATNDGDSFDRIGELDIPITTVKGLKSKSPLSLARNIKAIRKIIIENNIQIKFKIAWFRRICKKNWSNENIALCNQMLHARK